MKYRSLAKLTEGYCHNEEHLVTIIGILIDDIKELKEDFQDFRYESMGRDC